MSVGLSFICFCISSKLDEGIWDLLDVFVELLRSVQRVVFPIQYIYGMNVWSILTQIQRKSVNEIEYSQHICSCEIKMRYAFLQVCYLQVGS